MRILEGIVGLKLNLGRIAIGECGSGEIVNSRGFDCFKVDGAFFVSGSGPLARQRQGSFGNCISNCLKLNEKKNYNLFNINIERKKNMFLS